MNKKLMRVLTGALTLAFAGSVYADSVVQVWECNLKDGKTRDDLTAVTTAWTKAARSMKGGSEIQVFLETPLVAGGGAGAFNFVMAIPDAATWGTFNDGYAGSAAYEADEAWEMVASCTKSSLYSSAEIE